MSEPINKNDNRATIRWKLLTGASALALTAYVASPGLAEADDASRPQIWIELGGQLSGLDDGQETFSPKFLNSPARPSIFSPSQKVEGPSHFSIDKNGKLSFQPDNSDWAFSASVQYGRSSRKRQVHQQTYPQPFVKYYYNSYVSRSNPNGGRHKVHNTAWPKNAKFADTDAQNSERHFILDFQAGKDVGLGMFGSAASSTVNFGVRFAQFSSKTDIALKSNPDWQFDYKYLPFLKNYGLLSSKIAYGSAYHSNAASLTARRSFRGVGPSLSWNASAPFAGDVQNGQLTVDWGINVSLLFGRQRARTHHQTIGRYHAPGLKYHPRAITYQNPVTPDHTRSRNVTVPNVGGFAGLSLRYEDAKVSFGYKADFFFNAMDGGIDTRKNENRGFFGPYVSISVGFP